MNRQVVRLVSRCVKAQVNFGVSFLRSTHSWPVACGVRAGWRTQRLDLQVLACTSFQVLSSWIYHQQLLHYDKSSYALRLGACVYRHLVLTDMTKRNLQWSQSLTSCGFAWVETFNSRLSSHRRPDFSDGGGRQGRHCAPAQAPGVKVSQCKHGIPQEPRSHGHLRGRRAAGDGRGGSVAEGDGPSLAEDETAGFAGQRRGIWGIHSNQPTGCPSSTTSCQRYQQ